MGTIYSTLAYPHSLHRTYVRGCEQCLQRSKAGAARYTESRRRTREANRRRHEEYILTHGCPRCGRHTLQCPPNCDERYDNGR